jgi:hypothetical protein
MRLVLKLAVIVLLAVGCQWLLLGHGAAELDEAAFTARIFFANARGIPLDSPELLDAAWKLEERAIQRERRNMRRPSTRPVTPPTLVSVDEW